ncbi:MAG: Rieske (2Fe-2S) protein [Acidobacteriota bacterium]
MKASDPSLVSANERREFLKKALAAGALFCLAEAGLGFAGCAGSNDNPVSSLPEVGPVIDLNSEPSLQTVGGAVKKHITGLNNGRNIIIVRESAAGFSAFTSVCTHQGAEIDLPSGVGGNFVCPRHGSQFRSTDGAVAKGPASLPLSKFAAVYDAQKNTVTIS